MTFRKFLLPLFALSLLTAPARAEDAAPSKPSLQEKTVEVPRATKVALDIAYDKAVIAWVESQWEPDAEDVKAATEKSPKDKSLMMFRFTYSNEGWISHKVKLALVVQSADGRVLATGSRSSALDKQAKDDTITVPIRIKTAEWPKAATIRVTAAFPD